MQNTVQEKNPLYVPNWLIALELGAGAALLYISSSALINNDMHISRTIKTPATIETHDSVPSSDEKILLSAHSGAALYIK